VPAPPRSGRHRFRLPRALSRSQRLELFQVVVVAPCSLSGQRGVSRDAPFLFEIRVYIEVENKLVL
jgi:hypothetical protein